MAHDRSEKGHVASPAAQTKAADQGVGKATGVLPHLDRIQAAFGHHDVRGVGVEVGGDAAAAALSVGAHAYAFGDKIAFASEPDLHTAAHEAAHVIQQRAGVSVPGGIGAAGDAYERHADRVADAVVAGQSAEALLDEIALRPSARGTGAPAIQRKDSAVYINAYSYLKGHSREFRTVLGNHLQSVYLPTGHPRLTWKDDRAFYAKLFEQLKRLLGNDLTDAEAVRSVCKPHDPYEVIDEMRPIAGIEKPVAGEPTIGGKVGLITYRENIAVAVAQLFEGAIVQSLNRLGPRWLAAADQSAGGAGKAHGVLSLQASIAMSHHMDRAVLPAIMEPGVFEVRAESKKETAERIKDEATGKAIKTPPAPGTRKITKDDIEYVGDTDRLMWNWVRIKSPADATVEEVADYLFGHAAGSYGEKNGTFFAYGITVASPFFGIPGTWARRIPECNAHAPADTDKDQTGHQHNLQLAGGSVTDELALIEAGRHKPAPAKPGDPKEPAPTVADIGELIDDVSTQANTIKGVMAPWKLAGAVDKALVFIGRKLSEIKTPADAAKWKPVLAAQKETLKTIGGSVVALDATATQIGIKKGGPEAGQLRDIMMLFADAAASSHLADTSAKLIAQAGAMQSRLSLSAIESTTRSMAGAVDVLNESSHGPDQRTFNRRAVELEAESKAMQSKLLRGEQVSSEEIENYTLSANILALRAKTEATLVALRQLKTAAHDARDGAAHEIAAWFSGDFRELEPATESLESELTLTISDMDFSVQAETMSIRDPDDYRKAHHAAYKKAYETANKRFEQIRSHAVGEKSLKEWLSNGEKLIRRQELRAAIVKMAALLGISLIGGALGGVVTRMVAGVWGRFASAGLAELSMAGRMVSVGSGMAVDSLVGAAGQSAIYNESFGGNYAEHMLTAIGTHGVLSSLGAISHQMAQLKQSRKLLQEVNAMEHAGNELAAVEKTLEKVTPGKWKGRAMFVLSEGAKITGHAVMGAGLTYVAHRLVSGEHGEIPMTTLEEWAMQGSSVFVGRYVGHAMQHHMGAHKKLASIPDFEPGKRLWSESVELQKMADTLADENQPHNASTALEVLAKRHRVLLDEIDALEQISRSKELMKKYGVNEHQIRSMKDELHTQLDEAHAQGFEDISLHLAGLDELVPGAVWKGSRDNIETAIRSAERSGVNVEATRDPATGHWSVTLNGRKLTIHEHEVPGHGATPAKPGPGGGGGDHAPPSGPGGPASGEAQTDPNHADRALVTRAVPGSEFRGIEPGKPVGSVKDQANRGFVIAQEANYKMLGLTDVVPGVRTIQRSAAGGYVVTLDGGARFGVEVVPAPLDGQTVARAIVNPTKPGRIKVLGGELDVQGRHVIQLSTSMSLAQVERAIAGQLGVIATAHAEMIRGRHDGPSALGGNGSHDRMGALDAGRAAEINMLARQIHERPADAAALRTELAALVEHLGVRKGADGGDARWKLLEPELTEQARDEMTHARKDEGDYTDAERNALRKLRDKAYDDLNGQMKPGGGASDVHALPPPLAPAGKVADHARVAEAARIAMEFRAMKSERTLRSYRDRARALPSGKYVQVADLQIGGGAALAARRPSALLVDQRGRWQADGGTLIAQTAQQIRMLREAGIGDPREVAGPGERIPLDAIRYWEDSVAAQGEVIDGAASFRTGSKGEMLLDITPTDGSGRVTIEVTGTPTIATGFPTERAPGAARGITIVDSVLMLEHRLRVIADDSHVSQNTKIAALQLADTLKSLDGGESIMTATQAERALEYAYSKPGVKTELEAMLKRDKTDTAVKNRGPGMDDALQTLKASNDWQSQKNQDVGQQSLFLGDEANLWTIKKLVAPDNREAPKHVVVAGTGGTAISAVEIILASNPNVKVTMLGRDTPAGLAGNDQFRQVAKKHLDHEDAAKLGLPGGTVDERLRIVIDAKMDLGAPKAHTENGHQEWTAYTDPKTNVAYSGDAYISALGRENQVPPIVSEMIMRARLQGGDGAVQYKPLFDASQRFTGYQIAITIGKKTHYVEVTGSVSRFAPRGAGSPDNAGFRGDDAARIDRASRVDAHANSGGFDAGYGATADQSSAYARDRVARQGKKP